MKHIILQQFVKLVNFNLKPATISLWDQFSEVEASAIAQLSGPFSISLATRLKISPYTGKNKI